MRPWLIAALGVLSGMALMGQDAATYRDPHARDVLTRSRMAVGAGQVYRLSTLIMRGRSKTLANGAPVEAALEIEVVLPDCYRRVERAGRSTRQSGYCESTLLTLIDDGKQTSRPPARLRDGLLRAERARLVRLLLGAAAYISPELPLTFRSVAKSVAMVNPNQSASPTLLVNVENTEPFRVEVTGSGGFAGQFVTDSTMLPVRVEFAGAGGTTFSTSFTDRRPVSGLNLPFRMTTRRDDTVQDEVILDEILVNPELAKADVRR